MSLATRCASCGTIFRVVQDQLKASEGWVRCGRCDEVFNALHGLFDLEREPPPKWAPPAPEEAFHDQRQPATAWQERSALAEPGGDRVASRTLLPGAADAAWSTADRITAAAGAGYAELQAGGRWPDDAAAGGAARSAADDAAGAGAPAFMRRAPRTARAKPPSTRRPLAFAAGLLAVALALQLAHHFRDILSVGFPLARAPLAAWCAQIGCRIEPPRRIADLLVDNTTLAREATAGDGAYRLTVTLRNRGRYTVALPSVDLSLTDSDGQMIARRILTPADFGRTAGATGSAAIPANSESPLQVLLAAGATRVAGYTVELFYP